MFSAASPTRINIEEANKHLQMLTQRVNDLETTVKEQTEALIRKDDQTVMQLTELEREKSTEVIRLQRELKEAEFNVEQLRDMCRERDVTIAKLRQKATVLDEILKYKPMIEKLGYHLIHGERISVDMAKDSVTDNGDAYHSRKPSVKGKATPTRSAANVQKRDEMYNGQTVNSEKSTPRHTSTPSHSSQVNTKTSSASMKQNLATNLLTGTSYGTTNLQDNLYSAFSFDGPSLHNHPRIPADVDKELYL